MLACSNQYNVTNNRVIEGTSSNIFFVLNDQLCTPNINTCGVLGTMRQTIIALAKKKNIPVVQGDYFLHDIKKASEVFFSNSIFGLLPVASILSDDEEQWFFNQSVLTHQLSIPINTSLQRPIVTSSLFINSEV